ncbi:response regulator transcription factor [Saccharothrix obliqua]|uniref:response regulator transcription factor n=1 Tax=Saccharothrix obliqua TaxID=2861747 RepID=UPI0027E2BB95|nr:response regulator transcription factor [Saccharothrix obliqua]
MDDITLTRAGLIALLDAQPDLEVVGEAADGEQAVREAEQVNPDIVLMDLSMPGMGGVEATRRVVRENPPVAVIALTTFDTDEHVYGVLRAGASGFVLKSAPPEELLKAVRVVAAGHALLDPGVTMRLVRRFTERLGPVDAEPATFDSLTRRENEVIRMVAQGLSNREIGKRLSMTEATAKTHLNRSMAKLRLSSRAQVVAAAYEIGMILPGARNGTEHE